MLLLLLLLAMSRAVESVQRGGGAYGDNSGGIQVLSPETFETSSQPSLITGTISRDWKKKEAELIDMDQIGSSIK